MRFRKGLIISMFLVLVPSLVWAGFYRFKGEIIGEVEIHKAREGESLIEMARRFGLGYKEISGANPDLDPFVPGTDLPVVIPTTWILPEGSEAGGLLINISEMRLYYFFEYRGLRLVATFPVGVGGKDNQTPIGNFRVTEKIKEPTWHVPESIRRKKPHLPEQVPPGPDNPLGSHALRLSAEDILIHGTDKPWGVGRRISHGCIRLYPEHIPHLYRLVPVGEKVVIVRQPVKVGVKGKKVYVEVHRDDYADINVRGEAMRLLKGKNLVPKVSMAKLFRALKERSGVPVEITD